MQLPGCRVAEPGAHGSRLELARQTQSLQQTLTLVIFPPLKLAKRLRERVKTLDVLWMVKRLLAGTFFLHLREGSGAVLTSGCNPRSS